MKVVKKSSKLYKFYNTLGDIAIFSNFTSKNHWDEIQTFRDLCTFLRTTLFYIFASIPLWIAFIGSIIYFIFQNFIGIFGTFNSFNLIGVILLGVLICLGIIFLMFYITDKIREHLINSAKKESIEKQERDSANLSYLLVQSIKAKHNKICKSIEVIDE